jgi:hypothetical protein
VAESASISKDHQSRLAPAREFRAIFVPLTRNLTELAA